MKLIDSNVIIYSLYDEFSYLRDLVADERSYASIVSQIEVLGYGKLASADRTYYESIFGLLQPLPINQDIVNQAILIRQQKKMKLGDSLIAATGLIYDFEVATRNIKDFSDIPGLRFYNPIRD